jgi:hypothetical protein
MFVNKKNSILLIDKATTELFIVRAGLKTNPSDPDDDSVSSTFDRIFLRYLRIKLYRSNRSKVKVFLLTATDFVSNRESAVEKNDLCRRIFSR